MHEWSGSAGNLVRAVSPRRMVARTRQCHLHTMQVIRTTCASFDSMLNKSSSLMILDRRALASPLSGMRSSLLLSPVTQAWWLGGWWSAEERRNEAHLFVGSNALRSQEPSRCIEALPFHGDPLVPLEGRSSGGFANTVSSDVKKNLVSSVNFDKKLLGLDQKDSSVGDDTRQALPALSH